MTKSYEIEMRSKTQILTVCGRDFYLLPSRSTVVKDDFYVSDKNLLTRVGGYGYLVVDHRVYRERTKAKTLEIARKTKAGHYQTKDGRRFEEHPAGTRVDKGDCFRSWPGLQEYPSESWGQISSCSVWRPLDPEPNKFYLISQKSSLECFTECREHFYKLSAGTEIKHGDCWITCNRLVEWNFSDDGRKDVVAHDQRIWRNVKRHKAETAWKPKPLAPLATQVKFWIVKKQPKQGAGILQGNTYQNKIYKTRNEADNRAKGLTADTGQPYMVLEVVGCYAPSSSPTVEVEIV